MKKLLIGIFLFISTFSFAQVNWSDYWKKELPKTQESVQVVDKTYVLKIDATETELIFSISSEKQNYFTKYDNISISSLLYKELYLYSPKADKFKNLKTIFIRTTPYTRVIYSVDLYRVILYTTKLINTGDFINASQLQNDFQNNSQAQQSQIKSSK